MAQIHIAEIDAYDPALPGVTTLRFATQGYVTAAGDTPAHTYYDGRIQQPANVQRSCFERATTFGQSKIGYGELILVNNDGALDQLIDYGYDGRAITIKLGTVLPDSGGAPSWVTVLKGTMEQAEFSWQKVTIRVRDRQAELNKPLQANLHAGSNALPNGLEGVAGDLKGKPKPWSWGTIYNAPAPCVNTSRLIYQANNGAINTVAAVYDRGAALLKGADYVSQADMETTAPAAGYFRVWPAGGYFRLGSSPAGQITADIVIGALASDRTAAQAMKAAMLKAGLVAGDISAADVTALDAANSAEVGIWLDGGETAVAALDMLANSVGAWYGVDRLGSFRMGRIAAPGGTPVATLTPLEIISVDRMASRDDGRGVPAWRAALRYKRAWITQPSDLAGAVTDARRAELREEYRTVNSDDAAVQTAHPLAPALEFDTLLIDATAAQTEVDRRRDLYKVRRDLLEVRVRLDAALAAAIDIGNVVSVAVPRFGMTAGKLFLVIGVRTDLRDGRLDLTLWG